MTYIEKLMSAIKFDDEMLTQEEIDDLREIFIWQIEEQYCPYDMPSLKCPFSKCPYEKCHSEACWAQEIPA